MWYPVLGERVNFMMGGRAITGEIVNIEDEAYPDGPDLLILWRDELGNPRQSWMGAKYIDWELAQKKLI